MYYRNLALLSCIAALLLAGCGKPETDAPEAPETATAQPEPTPPPTPSLAELLASNARSDEDRARDADRNPAAVLEFLGIEPGMDVIDIMAAGGWYSEILAMAVGPDGSVTATMTRRWRIALAIGSATSQNSTLPGPSSRQAADVTMRRCQR